MSGFGCNPCTQERGVPVALVEQKKVQDPKDQALVTIMACPICGRQAAFKQRRLLYKCASCGHEEHEIVKGGVPEDPLALLRRVSGNAMQYSETTDRAYQAQQATSVVNQLRTTQAEERF